MFIGFQFTLVFTMEFLDALLFVLDPAFHLRDLAYIIPLEQDIDDADIGVPGLGKILPVAVVEFPEDAFFKFKIQRCYG